MQKRVCQARLLVITPLDAFEESWMLSNSMGRRNATALLINNSSSEISNIVWKRSQEIAESKVRLTLSELLAKMNVKTVIVDEIGGSDLSQMFLVVNTTNFNWYEPNNSETQPSMKRSGHTANVIGKYMVIAFGSGPNFNFEYKEKGEADVLLLDISNSLNYVWTDHFSPDAVIPPQSSSPQPTIATSTVATTITTSMAQSSSPQPSPPQLNITIKIIQEL
ncbi:unnamed protein product [Rhizophagus irregularis]|nr:unnamed protein product [Rhizophagus irregularis]